MCAEAIGALRGRHPGETGHLVGKGPSLLHLRAEEFGPGPIVALNDAILIVEAFGLSNALYSLQKDGTPEHMVRPAKEVALILQREYGADWFPEHPRRILVDPVEDMGFGFQSEMSIRMGIWLLKHMHCREIAFVCCDNLVNGSEQRVSVRRGRIDGDYYNGRDYTAVRPLVLADVEDVPHRFITPNWSRRKHETD
jgi:hypothetical protein